MPIKKVKIELDFDNGDFVYLITDPDKIKRQIVHVTFTSGGVYYGVRYGDFEPTEHQAFELEEFKEGTVE